MRAVEGTNDRQLAPDHFPLLAASDDCDPNDGRWRCTDTSLGGRIVSYLVAYIISLVLFAALDIAWLTTMGARLYKQTLGDILLPTVYLAPAAAFYLIYPAGLVYFGIVPALKSGFVSTAALNGALFGFFAYSTYELTNYATLRNWTFQITLIDIIYGAVASGAVAAAVTALLAHWRS
jgi:uncharacterized membrane protein